MIWYGDKFGVIIKIIRPSLGRLTNIIVFSVSPQFRSMIKIQHFRSIKYLTFKSNKDECLFYEDKTQS